MPEKQIKYVAVGPEGKIKGPMGDTREFVEEALVIGYRRTVSHNLSAGIALESIKKMGYTVRKAEIALLEEED